MRLLKIIPLLCFLAASTLVFARGEESCRNGAGQFERKFGNYIVRVGPAQAEQRMCRAVLASADGREIFSASDVAITLSPISGASVTNDGGRSLVLEGFSGGAHCCWTYWIADVSNPARLVKEIRNQTGIAFEHQPDGRVVMKTGDGAFDYFDDLAHVISPVPVVYLQMDGRVLKDISPQFVQAYDKNIEEMRGLLPAAQVEAFRSGQQPDRSSGQKFDDWTDVRSHVLTIVLDYLYSGREQQAWNTLDEMWPAADRERITQLIVETRAKGVLSQTANAP
jgi:hypothetical protein